MSWCMPLRHVMFYCWMAGVYLLKGSVLPRLTLDLIPLLLFQFELCYITYVTILCYTVNKVVFEFEFEFVHILWNGWHCIFFVETKSTKIFVVSVSWKCTCIIYKHSLLAHHHWHWAETRVGIQCMYIYQVHVFSVHFERQHVL